MANPLAKIHPYAARTDGMNGTGLQSVSCPTTSFCVAVGGLADLFLPHVLADLLAEKAFAGSQSATVGLSAVTGVENWNGTSWTASLAPFPLSKSAGDPDGFYQVACASPSACAATASYGSTGDFAFDEWNSRTWDVASWPGAGGLTIEPVLSCGAGSCMATFGSRPAPGPPDAVTVHVDVWISERWRTTQGVHVKTDFLRSQARYWEVGPPGCASATFCVVSGGADVRELSESFVGVPGTARPRRSTTAVVSRSGNRNVTTRPPGAKTPKDGSRPASQIEAVGDTWRWD
jgi:hypothetical protein